MVNQDKVRQAIKLLLEGIGEDTEREGLAETPDRIARMYTEILSGMTEEPSEPLSRVFTVENSEMVLEKDIVFHSMCEHHMLPFYGKVHVAYLPDGKVVGLSKLARTVEIYAKRLQVQERMTNQIADAIMEHLAPKGVMIVVEAEHMCMTMRGVKKPGSKTVSLATRGAFADNTELQNRFFQMLRMGDEGGHVCTEEKYRESGTY
ncbi:MAG: GTP cyclohydrolase I FolE [Acetatifactor sp.]